MCVYSNGRVTPCDPSYSARLQKYATYANPRLALWLYEQVPVREGS